MSIIHVNHIQSNCRQRFLSLIDTSDIKTVDGEERDVNFLSRALAAFAIAAAAKIEDAEAARSVVDEFQDDGIDAFYFDRTEHVAYLVQSKWSKNGAGSIDVGSTLKFVQGVNHLLENKISALGPKMRAKTQDIQDLLEDSQATFVLIIAYTGKAPLSVEVMAPINQLLFPLELTTGIAEPAAYVVLDILSSKTLSASQLPSSFKVAKTGELTYQGKSYRVTRVTAKLDTKQKWEDLNVSF